MTKKGCGNDKRGAEKTLPCRPGETQDDEKGGEDCKNYSPSLLSPKKGTTAPSFNI
jgi:hypothetical protein